MHRETVKPIDQWRWKLKLASPKDMVLCPRIHATTYSHEGIVIVIYESRDDSKFQMRSCKLGVTKKGSGFSTHPSMTMKVQLIIQIPKR